MMADQDQNLVYFEWLWGNHTDSYVILVYLGLLRGDHNDSYALIGVFARQPKALWFNRRGPKFLKRYILFT